MEASNHQMMKNCDLDYLDDLGSLLECTGHVKHVLDKLGQAVAGFGLCFSHSKCNVLSQDWMPITLTLILDREELTIVNCFTYFGNRLTKDISTVFEAIVRISEAEVIYAGVEQVWGWPNMPLKLKGHVYCTALRPEICLPKIFGVWRFLTIDVCIVSLGWDAVTAWVMWRLTVKHWISIRRVILLKHRA